MYDQIFIEKYVSDCILSHHPFNRPPNNLIWMPLNDLLHRYLLQVPHISSVVSIYFLFHLLPRDLNLGRINYDALVPHVEPIVRVSRLVLPPYKPRDHLRHPPERHLLRIEQVPRLARVMYRHVRRLRGLPGHHAVHVPVEEVVGHLHGPVADVRVEFQFGELFLRLESRGKVARGVEAAELVGLVTAEEGGGGEGLGARGGQS